MKVVAPIPVKGRLPLLKQTINRLYNKNGVFKVCCIGDTEEEREVSENAGADFVRMPNNPLGKKWNMGFQNLSKYNPDAYLFVGSSDWLSDNWLPTMIPLLDEYDMIGKPDFYLYDLKIIENMIGPDIKEERACHWPGYVGSREDEPIGIGRLLSARILRKMNFQPFNPYFDNSLDYSMFQKVKKLGGKTLMLRDDNIKSLSISTNQWDNKHKFEQHWNNELPSERIIDPTNFLKGFPETNLIF